MSITTILLDLDNTLIRNPDRAFAIDFLALFNQYMHSTLELDEAGKIFRQAIKLASTGNNPAASNTEHVVKLLAQACDASLEEAKTALDGFYSSAYPQLEKHITPIPETPEFIAQLKQAGYTLVIATNPLYSHEAVLRRMIWGKLPLEAHHYALITSADNMAHAKPHRGYYAKIFEELALEASTTVMIGDSYKNDIAPAQAMGMVTYEVKQPQDLKQIMKALERA